MYGVGEMAVVIGLYRHPYTWHLCGHLRILKTLFAVTVKKVSDVAEVVVKLRRPALSSSYAP